MAEEEKEEKRVEFVWDRRQARVGKGGDLPKIQSGTAIAYKVKRHKKP